MSPYCAAPAPIPRISMAPRLAPRNANPVTQLGSDRPERKKSSEVCILFRRIAPIPSTKRKYTPMMR